MTHWTEKALEILESDTSDLRKLADLAGADPATFYRGADLTGCDLRGQDLRGIDFTGANIWLAITDESTLIDARFKPLEGGALVFKRAEISPALYNFMSIVMRDEGIPYKSRTLRFLLERVYEKDIEDPHFLYNIRDEIFNDRRLLGHFDVSRKMRTNMSFKISENEHRYALRLGRLFRGVSAGYNAAALIGTMAYLGHAPSSASYVRTDQFAFDFVESQYR